ncbi:rabconnectin-3b isoform a [Anaeramoeba ignava]|uniref:Rabconnectin-3b isoform a n=1 Tax=Anaeramoeba ignava TaxID=1746090 RepID=A0A9Q0LBY1_ANAIG|nr:rabconnectin-3b isoform a [Anaeramoeba ignava]
MQFFNLVFPFWENHNPPKHQITKTLISENQTYIATGGIDGLITTWKVKNEFDKYSIFPISVLFAHNSEITSLINILYRFSLAFASVSIDGTLCIWNFSDGYCYFKHEKFFSCNPTKLLFHSSSARFLIASGRSNIIEIVDLETMRIARTFQISESWVLDIELIKDAYNIYGTNILLCLSDERLYYWHLPSHNEVTFTENSKSTQTFLLKRYLPERNQNSIALSPNQTLLLLVGKIKFYIYTPTLKYLYHSQPLESKLNDAQGEFLDNFHFMIWSLNSGKIWIYRIFFEEYNLELNLSIYHFIQFGTDNSHIEIRFRPKEIQFMEENENENGNENGNGNENENENSEFEFSVKQKTKEMNSKLSNLKSSQEIIQNLDDLVCTFKNNHEDSNEKIITINSDANKLELENMKFIDNEVESNDSNSNISSMSNSNSMEFSNQKIIDEMEYSHSNSFEDSNISSMSNSSSMEFANQKLFNDDFEPQIKELDLSFNSMEIKNQKLSDQEINLKNSKLNTSINSNTLQMEAKIQFVSMINEVETTETKSMAWIQFNQKEEECVNKISSVKKYEILLSDDFYQKQIENIDQFSISTGMKFANNIPNLLCSGNSFGEVSLWRFVTGKEKQGKLQIIPSFLSLKLETKSSLNDGWEKYPDEKRVTCNYIFNESKGFPTRILEGTVSGIINLKSIPYQSYDPNQKSFVGHDSEITALLIPDLEYSGGKRILISASQDLTMRIWEIDSKKQTTVFYLNSASVFALFQLDETKFDKNASDHYFCGVGMDHSVYICSFDSNKIKFRFGHPQRIQRIFWNTSLQYFAVQCFDDVIYLWSLKHGCIERVLTGELAEQYLLVLEKDYFQYEVGLRKKFPNQQKTTGIFTYMNPNSLSISGVLLDIPKVIEYYKNATIENDFNFSSLIPLHYLSCAFPQKLSIKLDNLMYDDLGIPEERAENSFGILGDSGALSLIVPKQTKQWIEWDISRIATATTMLASVSIGTALANSRHNYLQKIGKELISHFQDIIPIQLDHFKFPSLHTLCQFSQESNQEISQSAQKILSNCLAQLEMPKLKALAHNWELRAEKTVSNQYRSDSYLILAYIGVANPEALSDLAAKMVLNNLLNSLRNNDSSLSLSMELLGSGFSLWKRYVEDPRSVIHQLLFFTRNSEIDLQDTLKTTLFQIGRTDPGTFLASIRSQLLDPQCPVKTKYLAISVIHSLFQVFMGNFLDHLLELAQVFIILLFSPDWNQDPIFQINTSTAFNHIVSYLPMVDYNYKSNILAVGCKSGDLVIFALDKQTKIKIQGHKGVISALKFSPSSRHLASFSLRSCSVKVWKISFPIFSSKHLKIQPLKRFPIDKSLIVKQEDPLYYLKYVSLTWLSKKLLRLSLGLQKKIEFEVK